MPDPDLSEVLRQLSSIRRELRFVRWLLLFVIVALAVLLFAPEWVAVLASYAPPIIGGVALVVFAAVVVSHYKPSRPLDPIAGIKDPTI